MFASLSPEAVSESVVLLADEWLLQLPLEALKTFAVPQITSISRDFSLQFHYHRVHPAERSGNRYIYEHIEVSSSSCGAFFICFVYNLFCFRLLYCPLPVSFCFYLLCVCLVLFSFALWSFARSLFLILALLCCPLFASLFLLWSFVPNHDKWKLFFNPRPPPPYHISFSNIFEISVKNK